MDAEKNTHVSMKKVGKEKLSQIELTIMEKNKKIIFDISKVTVPEFVVFQDMVL